MTWPLSFGSMAAIFMLQCRGTLNKSRTWKVIGEKNKTVWLFANSTAHNLSAHADISRKSVGALPRNGGEARKCLQILNNSDFWKCYVEWLFAVLSSLLGHMCSCVVMRVCFENSRLLKTVSRWFVPTGIHMTAIINSFAAEAGKDFGAFF